MAFTPEDGTGKADANAGIDVTFADAYHLDRGNTKWADAQTAAKQTAIVRATDYVEVQFGDKFAGCKATDTQALSFPRDAVGALPINYKKAIAEYAMIALGNSLFMEPKVDASGAQVVRKKVGPIETEFSDTGGSITIVKPFPHADGLLKPLLRFLGNGGVIR